MGLTENIIVLAVGLLVIILWATTHFNKTDTLQQLQNTYEEALAGTSRQAAYDAGCAYYRYLRGGELLPADEQLILKDLAHMPEEDTSNNSAE